MEARSVEASFARAAALAARRFLTSAELTPGPVQRPVPFWLGYQGPKGAGRAGRAGLGLLSLDRDLLAPYRQGLAAGGHEPDAARMGGLVEIIVADDPPAAAERLLPHWLHQQNTYRAIRQRPDGSRPAPLDADEARRRFAATGRLGTLQVLDAAGAAAQLRARVDGLPARHAYTWLSLADMPRRPRRTARRAVVRPRARGVPECGEPRGGGHMTIRSGPKGDGHGTP